MSTETTERPVIENADPPLPEFAYGIVNPLMKLVLRSPLHGLVSDGLALITFTGRKSGNEYTTPVGYHEYGDRVLVFNDSGWWRNMVDGAPVELLIRGEWRRGTGTALPDSRATAERVHRVLTDEGLGHARRLGLKVPGDEVPDVDELAAAIDEMVAIEVELAE